MHVGIFIIDAETHKIEDANNAAIEMVGAPKDKIIGRVCHEYICPAELEKCPVTDLNQDVDLAERTLLKASGDHMLVLKSVTQIKQKKRKLLIESFTDISKLKQAEKDKLNLQNQLSQARKMEAIATLAGGIAHQFNNALNAITGNIELLEMDAPENINKHVVPMKNSALRMVNLANQLLAYARGGKYQPKMILMNKFLEDSLPIVKHLINPKIKVEKRFSSDLLKIYADFAQIQMVLSAILVNSSEAIENEGYIRIRTEFKKNDEEMIKHHSALMPGPYVIIIIEDNGVGMDEEAKSRIFEPFFTTKFQGRGLGMASAYGIIKNHGGDIFVDSESGKGTEITVYLPAIGIDIKESEEPK